MCDIPTIDALYDRERELVREHRDLQFRFVAHDPNVKVSDIDRAKLRLDAAREMLRHAESDLEHRVAREDRRRLASTAAKSIPAEAYIEGNDRATTAFMRGAMNRPPVPVEDAMERTEPRYLDSEGPIEPIRSTCAMDQADDEAQCACCRKYRKLRDLRRVGMDRGDGSPIFRCERCGGC